jgi:MFS family permease
MQNKKNTSVASPSTFRRWLVVMSAALLFFYAFFQINMLNSVDVELMHAFSINAAQLGTLSSMYFYANFLMVFPAGLLLDRFSTRKLILLAMIVAVISMFGFALTTNVVVAGIDRFISGLAGGFCFVGCVRLASRWFAPKHMALVIGCLVTMSMFGGMVAQTPMELLSVAWGWRNAIIAAGCLGIVFIFIIWLFVQDQPDDFSLDVKMGDDIESIGFWHSIKMVVLNRYNWLGGAYTALINLPVFLLGALWGNMYLVQVENLTGSQASYVITMLFFGSIIGSPLAGWFSDRIGKRRLPMMIGSLLSFVVVLAIIFVAHLSILLLLILFFLLGVVVGAQSLSYPTITELNSPVVTGSANSIISLVYMASGFIFQPLFGWLMGLNWNHVLVNNIPLYSVNDFRTAMLIMPVAFLVSFIAAYFIKETSCEVSVD